MRYADKYCTYVEEYKPEHVYIFTGECVISHQPVTVKVKADELYLYRQGALIQNALKSNTVAEREFLMSGITGEVFDEIFEEQE